MYIIVKRGIVQLSEQPCGIIFPIFVDHAEAKAFADRHGATAAEVGSIEGETLENRLNLAVQGRVRGMVIQGGIGRRFIDRK